MGNLYHTVIHEKISTYKKGALNDMYIICTRKFSPLHQIDQTDSMSQGGHCILDRLNRSVCLYFNAIDTVPATYKAADVMIYVFRKCKYEQQNICWRETVNNSIGVFSFLIHSK